MADINIQVGVTGGDDILKVTKGMNTLDRNVKLLATSFDKGKLTNQAYFKGLNQQISAMKRLGVDYRAAKGYVFRYAKDVRNATVAVEQHAKATRNLGVAQTRANTQTQKSNKNIARSSVLTQQAGYQVGDFLVQVQGGTNAMVAFGQQATQMAGTLTILGGKWIGIGTALGVTIPLLTAIGAYFMRTAKEQKEVADGAGDLESAFNSFNSKAKEVTEAVGDYTDALILSKSVANSDFTPLLNNLSQEIAARKTLLNVERERFRLQQFSLQQEVKDRRKVIDALFETSNAMRDTALSGATTEQERLQIQKTYLEDTKNIITANKELFLSQREQTAQLALIDALLVRNNDNLDEAVKQIEAFSDVDPSAGVREAAKAAQILADELGISLRAAMAMQGMITTRPQGDVFDPRDSRNQSNEFALERRRRIMEGGELTTSTLEKPTSGGSASTLSTTAADSLRTYKAALKEVMALEAERTALVEPMARAFTDGFTSMVDGTKSVKDAFKDMAREIIKQLWEIFVVEQMVNSITGAFGIGGGSGMTMTPKVNPLSGLSGAQMLPPGYSGGGYTGNGSRSGGMDGEGGFLAMLHPRETVVDHTKGQATGGDTINISQSFNFSANGDESVKKIIAQAAPQIAQMTQKSMMDQRRRGGAMKSTFG